MIDRTRRRRVSAAIAVLMVVGACGAGAAASSQGDVVRTRTGLVRGLVADDHRTFSGIPFAAPPVGDLRWRAPQSAASWTGIRDATQPGSRCPQVGIAGSEDCLYLNVTAPATAKTRLPVMVWIHGGGFVAGAGSDYNPARLAVQGDVVVVTLNYRLGALGFLLNGDVAVDDPAAGNYGLADQQAALRWVRDNIDAFGGDPGNVTLFGQSAGAFSVCAQLASPQARGLFGKAIVQSGPCGTAFVSSAVARDRGASTAAELGCSTDVAACLRAKPAKDLVGADNGQVFNSSVALGDMPWAPVADTPLVPEQPLDALQHGAAKGIPLIQGTTRDELRSFVALDYDARGRPVTGEQYPAIVSEVFGKDQAAVLAEYPVERYPSPGIALATVLADWGQKLGACSALPADDAAAEYSPVYTYEFAQDDGQRTGDFPLGAAHSAELPYLFSGPENALSRNMIGYWTSFAKTGDPGWARYRASGPVLSIAASGSHEVDFSAEHHCSFWRTLTP